jgi:DNA-binding transcriptional LysR family regulator
MTLQQLRYLVAIARAGSFSAAARQLFVTQPTLSQQITALEKDLGVPVVERGHRSVRLTAFGERAVHFAEVILMNEAALIRESQAFKHTSRVRLGSIHAALTTLLPDATLIFRKEHADVRITIEEGGSLDLAKAVASGDLDFGIVAGVEPVIPHGRFGRQHIMATELVKCRAGPRHERGACPAQPAEEVFISLRAGYLLHESCKSYLERIPHRAVIYAATTTAVLDLVAQGAGVSVLPWQVIVAYMNSHAANITMMPLPLGFMETWNWTLIWDLDRVLDDLDRSLIAAITECGRQYEQTEKAEALSRTIRKAVS